MSPGRPSVSEPGRWCDHEDSEQLISSSLQQVGTTQFSRTVSCDKIPGFKRRRISNYITIFQLWSIRTSSGIKGSESNQRTRTTPRRSHRMSCLVFLFSARAACPSFSITWPEKNNNKHTNNEAMKRKRHTARPKQAVHAGKNWEEVMLHVSVQISWGVCQSRNILRVSTWQIMTSNTKRLQLYPGNLTVTDKLTLNVKNK